MERERRSLRLGIGVIFLAVVLRLVSHGIGGSVLAFFGKPETASFLVYLQSGRTIRLPRKETVPGETAPPETQPPQTQPTQETEPPQELPGFTAGDADLVKVTYHCGYEPDIGELLCRSLAWELTGQEPSVLIYHSHATESYTASPGEDYRESSAYRTLDTDYNMVSVGEHLARLLRQQGIEVIHDVTLHDAPSYSAAYTSSRKSVQDYLREYPSIRLVIDLHRDALSLDSQNQLDTHAQAGGQASAQLMMVVGTDDGGLTHPNWKENMALALKLHVTLEKANPGITRPISFRTQRFNQDLSPGAVLIEVGGAGDTHAEALVAAEALAQAIATLAHGANTE